jgi:nuclear receptor subfamily 6 group A
MRSWHTTRRHKAGNHYQEEGEAGNNRECTERERERERERGRERKKERERERDLKAETLCKYVRIIKS